MFANFLVVLIVPLLMCAGCEADCDDSGVWGHLGGRETTDTGGHMIEQVQGR